MWIIEPNTAKADRYKKLLLARHSRLFLRKADASGKYLRGYIDSALHGTVAYRFFDQVLFEEMLTALPQRLIQIRAAYDNELRIQSRNYDADEVSCIKAIFNYNELISGDTDMSYALAKIMDINTCVYCNRLYTFTITSQEENIVRPQFDHWYPQCQYPEMALSYFNLIPSCVLCNSTLKHEKQMDANNYVHPYIDKQPYFDFGYWYRTTHNAEVICKNTVATPADQAKADNTLSLFKTKEIYNAHAKFELQELIDLAGSNPTDYISTLVDKVMQKLGVNMECAYRMLFSIEFDERNFLKRPLSKFKHDIIKQIQKAGNFPLLIP